MTNNYDKFLNCIFLIDNKGEVDFEELKKQGLNNLSIKRCKNKLIKDGIATSTIETMYAPEKPQPTFPAKMPSLTSQPDNIYNKPIFIFEVNNEKLNQLRPKIKNGEENNRGSHLIEFVRNSNKGNLRIENFNPLTFQELRCELINFFYNSPDRSWKSYEDIQQNIFGHNTETIRKTIKKINERVIKHTNNKYPEIIESKTDTKVFNSPKQYRWKF